MAVRRKCLRRVLEECGIHCREEQELQGMTLDSRRVQPGDLFLALPGARYDGRDYIAEALAKGAAAVLVDAAPTSSSSDGGAAGEAARDCTVRLPLPSDPVAKPTAPVLAVSGLAQRVGALAAAFYDHPSRDMELVAVTGTNGKGTVSHLLAQLLAAAGRPCALVGSFGWGLLDRLQPAEHTTPDAVSVQRILGQLAEEGARTVAMEVSSHALHQGRVDALGFVSAVFTNLRPDHLDYHGDMEHYLESKRALFAFPGLHSAVINLDDPAGVEIAAHLPKSLRLLGYGLENSEAALSARVIERSREGLDAELRGPWGVRRIRSALIGDFNLGNLLAAVGVAHALGLDLDLVAECIPRLQAPPGRMQRLPEGAELLVVVDYAHNAPALEAALEALRGSCKGSLWVVFGCGGERDPGRRRSMGQVAARLADHVILTADNPRGEALTDIIEDIAAGIPGDCRMQVEERREVAIETAIREACGEDGVLIAGKGHERYQLSAAGAEPFDDVQHARDALGRRSALVS